MLAIDGQLYMKTEHHRVNIMHCITILLEILSRVIVFFLMYVIMGFFMGKADNLRQQTLQQMHRVLTVHQAARGLLAMGDYFSRLRALSSLWIARPRD
jgi:predicted LPLAT superfamily acyltransferase